METFVPGGEAGAVVAPCLLFQEQVHEPKQGRRSQVPGTHRLGEIGANRGLQGIEIARRAPAFEGKKRRLLLVRLFDGQLAKQPGDIIRRRGCEPIEAKCLPPPCAGAVEGTRAGALL